MALVLIKNVRVDLNPPTVCTSTRCSLIWWLVHQKVHTQNVQYWKLLELFIKVTRMNKLIAILNKAKKFFLERDVLQLWDVYHAAPNVLFIVEDRSFQTYCCIWEKTILKEKPAASAWLTNAEVPPSLADAVPWNIFGYASHKKYKVAQLLEALWA